MRLEENLATTDAFILCCFEHTINVEGDQMVVRALKNGTATLWE